MKQREREQRSKERKQKKARKFAGQKKNESETGEKEEAENRGLPSGSPEKKSSRRGRGGKTEAKKGSFFGCFL